MFRSATRSFHQFSAMSGMTPVKLSVFQAASSVTALREAKAAELASWPMTRIELASASSPPPPICATGPSASNRSRNQLEAVDDCPMSSRSISGGSSLFLPRLQIAGREHRIGLPADADVGEQGPARNIGEEEALDVALERRRDGFAHHLVARTGRWSRAIARGSSPEHRQCRAPLPRSASR